MGEHMPSEAKTYRSHGCVREGCRQLVRLTLFLIAIVWLLPTASLLSRGAITSYPLRLTAYLSVTLCCAALLFAIAAGLVEEIGYFVAGGCLVRAGSLRSTKIKLSSVTDICRRWWGVVELRSADVVIRIPLFIAELPDLIDEIGRDLAEAGNLAAVGAAKVESVRTQAIISQWSMERLLRIFPCIVKICILFFAVGLVVSYSLWQWPLFLAVSWALASMMVPIATLTVAEVFLLMYGSRKMRRRSVSLSSLREEYFLAGVGAVMLVAYLIAGIGARVGFDLRSIIKG